MIITVSTVKSFLGISDPCQASGLLTIGQLYEIKQNTGGANFLNVGAADNNVGTQFNAIGTTPTAWGTGLLYIVDEARDDKILALIPVIEADYRRIRGVDFLAITGDLTTGSKIIENVGTDAGEFPDEIEIGMILSGSGIQSKVDTYDADLMTITAGDNATVTTDDVDITCFPAGADYTAALMIEYNLYKRHGFQSERTGDYSYSQEEIIGEYPKSIASSIRRYVRMS